MNKNTPLSGVLFSLRILLLLVLTLSAFVFPQRSQAAEPKFSIKAQGLSFPAEINKKFEPISIVSGGISRLSITVFNPNSFQLIDTAWADNLIGIQPGISIANPVNLTNTCGGTVVAPAGGTALSLSGGTVPPQISITPGACTVSLDVTSTTPGNLINTIPTGGLTGTGGGGTITNTTPASATLNVSQIQAPTLNKSFTPNTMWVGQTSVLTIVVRNNDLNSALTQAFLTDNLPANVFLANPALPANPLTNCGGTASLTVVSGGSSVTLNNATIAANSTCTIRVNVTSATQGIYNNTIPSNSIQTQQGVSNSAPASATLNVQALDLTKAFTPPNFQAGGISTLTITLQNPTGSNYTGVNLSDTLPGTVLTVVNGSAATTCGGVVSTTLPRTVSLTGGIIPAGTVATPGTCTITVQITAPAGATAATFTNIIPANALTTDQGVTNVNPATAQVRVYATGTGINGSKSFNPTTIVPGANSRLRINITAPADTALTNFSIVDNLPANVTISNSTPATKSANCGAGSVLTAVTGATSISLTNGTIPAGTLCRIEVYVTSSVPGVYTNTINPGNISNNEGRTLPGPITANLTVQALSDLSVSKAFTPNTVSPNGISTLTITLTNTNASPLINVSLIDNLPGTTANGIVIAPTPNASTTCGSGIITAVAGTQTVSMAGGTIPAQANAIPGTCTINVDVQGKGSSTTRTNTIPVINVSGTIQATGITINPVQPASASLTITNLSIGVVKGFDPLTVFGGSASTLSVQLINPNNAQLTGIAFIDTMPNGMIVASPANPSVGTCGGSFTAVPGTGSYSYSGGNLPPAGSCTLTISVTMTVNGNLTNVIAANAVTTTNGASNPQAAEASLTNLPGASISKSFSPNPINAGDYSLLTITIRNTGNVPLTGMGLNDTLPGTLPTGLLLAGTPAPAPVNNCNGTLTAVTGTQLIQLAGGTLAASSSCTIIVAVTGTIAGSYQNIIPAGTLTTSEGATNNQPAIDTLVVIQPATASLGDYVWNDTNANGIQDGTEVGVNGVTVNLYSSAGTLVATTTTGADGKYLFSGLIPGDYYVEFVPPTGYALSSQDQGVNDTVDSDANITTGQTAVTALVAGENDLSWDAGLYQLASLGDFVWNDVNANGIQDVGETGIGNVTVELFNSAGVSQGTTVTNANGAYSFTGLTPGDYYVRFTAPSGYIFSPQDQGGNDAVDSDANTTTGQTITTTLISGENDLTWDAGLYQPQKPSGLIKTILATNSSSTTGTDVAIGEIATYQIAVAIPSGVYPNLKIVDTLDRGLAYVDCVSIDSGNLTNDLQTSFADICPDAAVEVFPPASVDPVDIDRRVTFNFGTVTNANTQDQTLTITYRAIVLNNAENQDGLNLKNSAQLTWGTASLPPASTTVKIVEPELSIDKTSDIAIIAIGSEVTFTLTIRHTPNSHTDALDVIVNDPLPSTLDFVSGSLNCTTGDQDPLAADCLYDPVTRTIHAEWDVFTLGGGVGQIRFRVVGNTSLPVNSNVTNIGSASWTSMPGDVSLPQSYTPNPYAAERDYDPGDPINLYHVEDTLVLRPSGDGGPSNPPTTPASASASAGFLIPVTGFAPNVITNMSQTPWVAYVDTTITLEIPTLGVNIPIVGVPRKDGAWNVSWLGNQAGWLEGSAFPSWNGNSVLTSHVYLSNGKPGPFAKLHELKYGDQIIVHAYGQKYIFELRAYAIVTPNDKSIMKHEEKAWLTLVTCMNYDEKTNTYKNRFIARAVLVKVTNDK